MYSKVIYLLYNGSHYDVFVKKLKEGRELGIFEISDKYIKKEVLDIANEIKKKNKARNAKIIKLKCNDCNCILEADFDARNHLKKTGHVNFQQIEDNYSN